MKPKPLSALANKTTKKIIIKFDQELKIARLSPQLFSINSGTTPVRVVDAKQEGFLVVLTLKEGDFIREDGAQITYTPPRRGQKLTGITGASGEALAKTIIKITPIYTSGLTPTNYTDLSQLQSLPIPAARADQKLLTARLGRDNFRAKKATQFDPIFLDGRSLQRPVLGKHLSGETENVGIVFNYQDKFDNSNITSTNAYFEDDTFAGSDWNDYINYPGGMAFGFSGQDRLSAPVVDGGDDNDALRGTIAIGGRGNDQLMASFSSTTLSAKKKSKLLVN